MLLWFRRFPRSYFVHIFVAMSRIFTQLCAAIFCETSTYAPTGAACVGILTTSMSTASLRRFLARSWEGAEQPPDGTANLILEGELEARLLLLLWLRLLHRHQLLPRRRSSGFSLRAWKRARPGG